LFVVDEGEDLAIVVLGLFHLEIDLLPAPKPYFFIGHLPLN
jgi:hypothetical protein